MKESPEPKAKQELVLELQGLSKQYGTVQALSAVSLDCWAGEIHAVVGENGSGKSTLLGIASGFVEPDQGIVRSLAEVSNQKGEAVMTLKPISFIRCRPAEQTLSRTA